MIRPHSLIYSCRGYSIVPQLTELFTASSLHPFVCFFPLLTCGLPLGQFSTFKQPERGEMDKQQRQHTAPSFMSSKPYNYTNNQHGADDLTNNNTKKSTTNRPPPPPPLPPSSSNSSTLKSTKGDGGGLTNANGTTSINNNGLESEILSNRGALRRSLNNNNCE